jgi:hypothetical protein
VFGFLKVFNILEISLPFRPKRRNWREGSNGKKEIIFYIKRGLPKLCQKAF